jgi:hypothetical protein
MKTFDKKSHYIVHINRKRPCSDIIADEEKVIQQANAIKIKKPNKKAQNSNNNEKHALDDIKSNKNNTKIYRNREKHALDERKLKNYHTEINQNENNSTEINQNETDSDTESNTASKKCQNCKKKFSQTSSLNRHLKDRCKVIKKQNNEKEELLTKLLNGLEEIKLQNKQFAEQNKQIVEQNKQFAEKFNKMETNNTNSNNTNCNTANIKQFNQLNNVNNNVKINLLAFRQEDLSYIKDDIYKKILNKGFKSVPTLVEHIHFNKNKPENNNIYISNMRDKHILVYDGNDWKLKEKDEILQQLVDDKADILSEKFEELLEKLDEPTIKKFKRFLEQKDEDCVISDIKDDLKLLLYNNKKITEKTRAIVDNDKGKLLQ